MLKFLIFIFSLFLCINLGYSQTTAPTTSFLPAPTPIQVPLIGTPTVNPTATTFETSTSTTPQKTTAGNDSPGKYDEYQSICRQNEYDNVAHATLETRQKRILFLIEKIKKDENPTKIKLRLLKEYIDQMSFVETEKFYIQLKEEKLDNEDIKIADALFETTKKDFKKAASILEKVMITNPKNKVALKYLAEIYKSGRNYFESVAAYLDLEKLTSEDYALELCEVYLLDSQHKEAEKFCKKAIQLYKTNPYPLIYLGVSQREKLNLAEAAEYFKQSLKVKPTEMGFSCLAEIFYIKEDYSNSISEFKKAIDLSPGSARAHLGLAWAQFKNKSYVESLDTFKMACKQNNLLKSEIRKAFKILANEKSNYSKNFADAAQNCNN